jgi:hypothetical protein
MAEEDKGLKGQPDPTDKGVEKVVQPAPVEKEGIDYRSELQKVLMEREIIAQDRDNYRKALLIKKGKKEDDGTAEEIIKQANEESSEDVIQKAVKQAMTEMKVDDIIAKKTTNPDEQALIRYHYENSIRRTGKADEDVNNAYALANRARILKENKEMKVALQNKSQISNLPGGASQEAPEVKTELWSPEQLEYFKERGLDPNAVFKNWQNQNLNMQKMANSEKLIK